MQRINKIRLAVAGAGLAGRQHINAIRHTPDTELTAVAEPDAAAWEEYVSGAAGDSAAGDAAGDSAAGDLGGGADESSIPRYDSLPELLAATRPDGVVIATPTRLHPRHGLACFAAGVPALIEKPLAADTAGARALVAAAKAAGAALLVGHHRRHNPLAAAARATIDEGKLGRLVAVHSQTWLYKPRDYFRAEWRRRAGAGPVFINLIHDIDTLRYLCGEVAEVHALESNAVRGFEVEDTAAVMLRFANGALGTMSLSDATVAPWSWELTARENPVYPATAQSCYWLGGTRGSLSLPDVTLWQNPGADDARGWWQPIAAMRMPFDFRGDSMLHQIRHFAEVVRGAATPLVSGEDGLASLAVVEAIKASAADGGRMVRPDESFVDAV